MTGVRTSVRMTTCRMRAEARTSSSASPASACRISEIGCPRQVQIFLIQNERLTSKLADVLHALYQIARLAGAQLAAFLLITLEHGAHDAGLRDCTQRRGTAIENLVKARFVGTIQV